MASLDLLIVILLCFILILISVIARNTTAQETKTLLLERRLNLILTHLGIKDDAPEHAIQELILRGQKIQAIKLYREQSGVGLKEAKDAVDQMQVNLKAGLWS